MRFCYVTNLRDGDRSSLLVYIIFNAIILLINIIQCKYSRMAPAIQVPNNNNIGIDYLVFQYIYDSAYLN